MLDESRNLEAKRDLKEMGKKDHAPYAGTTKMLSIYC
jgi:hypothetical protein